VIRRETVEALNGVCNPIELLDTERVAGIDCAACREAAHDQPSPVVHADRYRDDLRVSVRHGDLCRRACPIGACLRDPEMRDRNTGTCFGRIIAQHWRD